MEIRKETADLFRDWVEKALAHERDARAALAAKNAAERSEAEANNAYAHAQRAAGVGRNIPDKFFQIDHHTIHAHYDETIVDGKVVRETITLKLVEVCTVKRE